MTFKPDIDPVHGKLDASIALGGKPEFLASDASGKAYINLEDKNSVAVVDLKTRKVIAHWPTAPGGAPVGMVLDEKSHHLFIGGREPQTLIVMDTQTGKVVTTLPIGPSVDATKLEGGEIFASGADELTVARATAAGKFEVVQRLKTSPGSRTMGIDPSTHTIYMPSAEFLPLKPGETKPVPKPGSFRLLVVTQAK
jgi:DNA-binding beta-propeller fold protein YncE